MSSPAPFLLAGASHKDDSGTLKELQARFAHVPVNAAGGVPVSADSIARTFALLSRGGRITRGSLTAGLRAFHPTISDEEVSFLLGGGRGMTEEGLRFLLADNAVAHFDPPKEAFRAFAGTHAFHAPSVDYGRVQAISSSLHLACPLEEEDMALLKAAVGGGKAVGLEGFRKCVAAADSRPPEEGERLTKASRESD